MIAEVSYETVASEKRTQRQALIDRRDALDPVSRAAIDAEIAQRLFQQPEFMIARTVFSFYSVGSEVDTHVIIERALSLGKMVALPRCVPGSRTMEWYAIDSLEGLVPSSYGIPEPAPVVGRLVDPASCVDSLCIVPGLAFDTRGYRLGYGGGYYDIFLSTFPGFALGLCRESHMASESIARESFDRPVSAVLTEARMIRASW
ncbi:5-formyltetrahydrofolate cyclo-ligase [Denitrobacterium detoxificans]|jgi:5-formyltetrahydrofolate cyclo-ligase|uniref:5-formyltetrahydrofolate cyclo-ligase n=1 Tax=Denitrobacterium detoxificans TaxID=79604 RepID=UPI0026F2F850|nr:5-formyltetrahydrofolate cyclo-ligase [Denitrobacterium detoxificans]MBE6466026.1 5-formyltetrahydrofolate cyclo-ligase [Denitrobacterium detoxificans]